MFNLFKRKKKRSFEILEDATLKINQDKKDLFIQEFGDIFEGPYDHLAIKTCIEPMYTFKSITGDFSRDYYLAELIELYKSGSVTSTNIIEYKGHYKSYRFKNFTILIEKISD